MIMSLGQAWLRGHAQLPDGSDDAPRLSVDMVNIDVRDHLAGAHVNGPD